jgi:TolB-like protein/Tfp pilus assembly protein PilF
MSGNFHVRWRKAALLIVVALCASGLVRWYLSHTPSDRPPVTRVAVLPFDDYTTGGPGDGFSAELISRLSTIRSLQVIARSSAFRLRGADTHMVNAEVAARLHAGSIVRGSVRLEGDSLDTRVVLYITTTDPPETLWSREYRRAASDYFKVQSEVAQEIALALNVPVGAEEKRLLGRGGTRVPAALREYLQGRDAQSRGTAASAVTGAEHFAEAIAIDPAFAAAYSGLAECHTFAALQARSPEARDTAAAKAKQAAQNALKLDPSNAEAATVLALVRFRLDWKFREAETGFRRALGLKPGLSAVHLEYGRMLALLGRYDESIAEISTTARLDPLATDPITAIAGVRYCKREYEGSIEEYRRAIAADPSDAAAHLGMAMSCVAAIHYREAVESVNEALRFTGETDETLAALGYVYAKRGDRAQAIEILDKFRQPAEGTDPSPFFAALILRGLDRGDDAMSFLELAYARRDSRLPGIGVDPAWDGSRSDPRFSALLKKIGLPD